MPDATPLLSAFNSGEFSGRMLARSDFQKYRLAARKLENMLPLPQGGAARRPGTVYVSAVDDSSVQGRLLPFEFNTEQAYVIEAAEQKFRFYRNNAAITVADTTAAVSNGTFTSGITDWDDRSTGTGGTISHDATNGRLNLNSDGADEAWAEQDITTGTTSTEHVLSFQVIGVPTDYVLLRLGTTSEGAELLAATEYEVGYHTVAFTPGASPFYVQFGNDRAKTVQVDNVSIQDNQTVELKTPYVEADLPELKFAQSADVMYICHEDYPVYSLERSGHTSWSLVQVNWLDGPYLDENASTTTLTASATTGLGITITASATTGINGTQGFLATDVGRLIRKLDTNTWGYAIITAVTDTTNVTVDVIRDFGATTGVATWRLGSWSGTTGYPAVVTFFEQRLVLAANTNQPQTLFWSQSDDYENMQPDSEVSGSPNQTNDDDALVYTIGARKGNLIRWMEPFNQLVIGTSGGEWVATSDGPLITPTDVDIKQKTTFGSQATVLPRIVRGRLMFLQRAARKVLEFTFSFEIDNFQALDQTLLANTVSKGGITAMDYQQELDSVLWCVRADGQMPTLTFQPDQNVIGWARQIIGGAFGSGSAVAESVVVIPASGQDEVWAIVKRTINGATARYIEYFALPHEEGDAQADAIYVDSAVKLTSLGGATVTGGDHLEGETVSIWADGAVHPQKTVSSGGFTLDYDADTVVFGLPYTHKFQTLKLDAGSQTGTAQGMTKRVDKVTLILLESLGSSIGPSETDLDPLSYRDVDDLMDTAVPLFTGELDVDFDGDYETDPAIWIVGSDPAPFTLLGMVPSLQTNKL